MEYLRNLSRRIIRACLVGYSRIRRITRAGFVRGGSCVLEIMWSVAFLTSGVFLCHPVSYEFSKGLTADFSFSLLHVGVKVDGYHEVSLMNVARGLPNAARVP